MSALLQQLASHTGFPGIFKELLAEFHSRLVALEGGGLVDRVTAAEAELGQLASLDARVRALEAEAGANEPLLARIRQDLEEYRAWVAKMEPGGMSAPPVEPVSGGVQTVSVPPVVVRAAGPL